MKKHIACVVDTTALIESLILRKVDEMGTNSVRRLRIGGMSNACPEGEALHLRSSESLLAEQRQCDVSGQPHQHSQRQ